MNKSRIGNVIPWLSVAAIVGVLLVLIPPSYFQAQERAKRIRCNNLLKHVGLGLKMYAGDHDNAYPDRLSKISKYVAGQYVLFCCPSSGNKPGNFDTVDEWTDYIYVPGLSDAVPPNTVVMYCPAHNHKGEGGNVLFVDGHVEWLNSEKHCHKGETSFEEVIATVMERSLDDVSRGAGT